jgi:hypothetical protein
LSVVDEASPAEDPIMARNKIIQGGETIGLQLDADERGLILALKLARPEIRDRIRQTPEPQEIRLTFDQWDDLAGRIAAEAHLTEDRGLERIARKIGRLTGSYFVEAPDPGVRSPLLGWIAEYLLDAIAAGEPSDLPMDQGEGGETKVGLRLTEHQRRTILDHVPLPEGLKDRLQALPGGQQVVELTGKELDDLQIRVGRATRDTKYPPKKTLLAALKRIARTGAEPRVQDRPAERVRRSEAAGRRSTSGGRSGMSAGAPTEAAHEVIVPLSAAERRLILEATDLDDEIAERLGGIDPREENVRLTISELVQLAIATAGGPTRPMSRADRKRLDRLSDRIHGVVANCRRPSGSVGD